MIARGGGMVAAAVATLAAGGLAAQAPLTSGTTMLARPTTIRVGQGARPVEGYRSARFGMSAERVRAAVAVDFGAQVAAGLHAVPVERGFTALSTTASGALGDWPVELRYVFGENQLVTVNLIARTGPAPADAERNALVEVARAQAADLLGHDWRQFSTVLGRPTGPNSVLVAAVTDDLGNGATIELRGVGYTARFDDGSERAYPSPNGPATLRIAYARDIDGRLALAPDAFVTAGNSFRIDGFRSVRFGMTEPEVLALAARDLNTRPSAITRLDVKSEGTTALVAATLRLDPGPTPAMVSYVFGATSHRLAQVVVRWSYPAAATDLQRRSIAEAGVRLKAYLQAAAAQAPRRNDGGATKAGDLILYRVWDGAGHALMLSMDDRTTDGDLDADVTAAIAADVRRLAGEP